jgi:hypothetical protein
MGTSMNDYGYGLHAAIVEQHQGIRARLRGLDVAAEAAASSPVASAFLRVSLLRLAVLFDAHLDFEERTLGPRIRGIDAWGAAREEHMLREHAEQRTRLQHACAIAEDEAEDGLSIAREVSRLVVSLLDDMSREESELRELDRLDEELAFEQMTG